MTEDEIRQVLRPDAYFEESGRHYVGWHWPVKLEDGKERLLWSVFTQEDLEVLIARWRQGPR